MLEYRGFDRTKYDMFGLFGRRRARLKQASADAEDLIARFGDGAYAEARKRAREARESAVVDGNRSKGHWDRVRAIIARETGRDGLDTATRYSS
jgi:hypothetical protein